MMLPRDLPADTAEDRAAKAVLRRMHTKLMYENMKRCLRCGLCQMSYAVITLTAADGGPRFAFSGYVENWEGNRR